MKKIIYAAVVLMLFMACTKMPKQNSGDYTERYRPQIHFTPDRHVG